MTDIRNNVYAGRVVTAHEHNINFNSWSGSGYIILDPTTGTGAYLIDGGANGAFAFYLGVLFSYLILMTLTVAIAVLPTLGVLALPIIATVLLGLISAVAVIMYIKIIKFFAVVF